MEHVKAKHAPGETCSRTSCTLCDLFICAVCNGAEGTLPTDCPGGTMTAETQDAIYAGRLDFKRGVWIKKAVVLNLHHVKAGRVGTEDDVYIGRARGGFDGYFGNPYKVGQLCPRCDEAHNTPASTLPCFDALFNERIASNSTEDREYRQRLRELRGKRLWCWCKPNRCHGDTMIRWINAQHVFDEHTNCRRDGCMVCEGGLTICTICHAIEGSVPTECPLEPMSEEQRDAVHKGRIDYLRGQWVTDHISPHSPAAYRHDGRVLLVHPEHGVYLGSGLGLQFWSKVEAGGQTAAVTFASESAAKNFATTYIKNEGLRYIPIEPDDGYYASMDACARAGIERWSP